MPSAFPDVQRVEMPGVFHHPSGFSPLYFFTIIFNEIIRLYRLSATAGVDFEALREKYGKIAQHQKSANSSAVTPISDEEALAQKKLADDHAKLDQIRACNICHGSGMEQYVYNNIQRERDCEHCDGSGFLKRQGFVYTSSANFALDKEQTVGNIDSDEPPPLS